MGKIKRISKLKLISREAKKVKKIMAAVMLPFFVFNMASLNILTLQMTKAFAADEISISSNLDSPSSSPSDQKKEEAAKDTGATDAEKLKNENVDTKTQKEDTNLNIKEKQNIFDSASDETSQNNSPINTNPDALDAQAISGNTVLNDTLNTDSSATENSDAISKVEEAQQDIPLVTKETWSRDGNKATTNSPVETGVQYIAPQNDQVSVTFTKLPENPGKLSIEEITLTKEQVAILGALSNKAYDITSDMKDGTFEYKLTLPKPKNEEDVEVKYAESIGELKDAKEIPKEEIDLRKETVSLAADHFTIFVVGWNFPNNPDDAIADLGVAMNASKTITVINTDSIGFSNVGATTRSARADGWDNGAGLKYWEINFNSTDFSSLLLSSKQRSSGTGPKDFKVQYKIGSSGTWTDFGTQITVADDFLAGVLNNVSLPEDANNQLDVHIRWVMTSNFSVNSSGGGMVASGGASNIDDIMVTGTLADSDADNVGDSQDNCPSISNEDQADSDGDGVGDVCDNSPLVSNPGQEDADGDGVGDASDNCVDNPNPGQEDSDGDGVGDVCDNCVSSANPDQEDDDGDGIGNECDSSVSFPDLNESQKANDFYCEWLTSSGKFIFVAFPGKDPSLWTDGGAWLIIGSATQNNIWQIWTGTEWQSTGWHDYYINRPIFSDNVKCNFSQVQYSGLGGEYIPGSYSDISSLSNPQTVSVPNFDSTPPDVAEITAPQNNEIISGSYEIQANAEDDGTGINKVEFYHQSVDTLICTDNDASDGFSCDWDTTLVTDGDHSLYIIAYDKAGNQTTSENVDVVVDNSPPTTPSATPSGGDYYSDQSVSLSSSDDGSGVANIFYTLDGSDPDDTKTSYSTPIVVDKDMTIRAIAYDNAGNASGIMEETYGIAPNISGEASGSVTTDSVTITWTTDDPSTSRVVYDTVPHIELGQAPNYGYAFSTTEDDTKVTSHSVVISKLSSGTTYYYRVISHGSPEAVGQEFSFATTSPVVATSNHHHHHGHHNGGGDNGGTSSVIAATGINGAQSSGVRGVSQGSQVGQNEQKEQLQGLFDNQQGTKVEGAVTCKSWPFWAWILVLIIFTGNFLRNIRKNFNERRYRWVYSFVWTGMAAAFWYYFDKCREYMWFLYISVLVALISYIVYIYLLSRKVEKNMTELEDKKEEN